MPDEIEEPFEFEHEGLRFLVECIAVGVAVDVPAKPSNAFWHVTVDRDVSFGAGDWKLNETQAQVTSRVLVSWAERLLVGGSRELRVDGAREDSRSE